LPFSHPHPDLFPQLISSVFHRYSLCPFISIYHFHLSCLVSALLSTHVVAHNQLDLIREGRTESVGEIGEISEVEDNRHMLIHHDDDSV